MKTFFAALLLCSCAVGAAAQGEHNDQHPKQESAAPADSARILRGEAIGIDTQRVSFADALKEPHKYAGKTIVIEGVVRRVCQAEGCWVEISARDKDAGSVRVTFDHKFAVPKDATSMKFRAEGKLKVKRLSKERVEHLVKDDGAKIRTKPDGTAEEVTFLATGVELWK